MSSLRGATVLGVDAEPDLCEMLAFEFRLQGCSVLSSGDGDGAFELLQSQPVDAVITDIQMAHGNGIELLDRIRARDICKPPVVFITAYDTTISPADAYERGAEGFYGKPFRLKDLIDRVDCLLTVPQLRWADPPPENGAVKVAIEYPSLHDACRRRLLRIGRGGMALSTDGAVAADQLELGRAISFDLRFLLGPISAIQGTGTVRWLSEERNRPVACGFEFDYVAPGCRDQLLNWLALNPCRPFVPQLA